MNQTGAEMERLARAWSDAALSAEPPLDLARSRERFLAIQRRRDQRVGSSARRWALAAAAAVVLSVGALAALHPSAIGLGDAPEPGAWVQTGGGEQLPLQFSEGSEVVVEGASRVRVASVDPRGARMVIERGTVSARIEHREDTRWSFEAGPFAVRVTGTELRVSWDPDQEHFEVRVDRGSVIVSGPLLEQGRTVRDGQRCAVRVRDGHLEVARLEPELEPEAAARVEVSDPALAEPAAEPTASGEAGPPVSVGPSWQELERQGNYAGAVSAAERAGLGRIMASGSASDLMSLARAARHAGRAEVVDEALQRCRTRFPGSPQAATAAFLLGRSAQGGAAAQWFSTYLREQPGGPLAREAAGRLIECHQRSGNTAAASDAARRYLGAYPTGPHAGFARSVLAD